jgi:hypothetical protein
MKTKFYSAGILFMAITHSFANLVQLSENGHVTQVNAGFSTGIQVGDAVHWTASYDTSAPDADADPGRVFLQFPSDSTHFVLTQVSTSSGTFSFDSVGTYVFDYDKTSNPDGDLFEISGGNTPNNYWPANLLSPNAVNYQVIFYAKQTTAPFDMVDGASIPASGLPDLTKADVIVGEIRALGNDGNELYDIFWTPDTQGATVPEHSSSVALLALGFFGVIAARRMAAFTEQKSH